MRIPAATLILGVTMLLAGCAAAQWEGGDGVSTLRRDRYECERDWVNAPGNGVYDLITMIRGTTIDRCMEAKGYTR